MLPDNRGYFGGYGGKFVPVGTPVVSESGISSREDIITMMECGVNAVLVGEGLVTSDDIPAKIKELMA